MGRLCYYDEDAGFVPYTDEPEPQKPQTNADRIRSASDEELARFLDFNFMTLGQYMDYEKWLSWLREDAEDVPNEYYENGGK